MTSSSRSSPRKGSVAGFVRDTIARDPSPPRRIGLKDVLRAVFRTAVAGFSLVFAIVLVVSGLGLASVANSTVVWIIAGSLCWPGARSWRSHSSTPDESRARFGTVSSLRQR
jgi:threonine/homoserine/homoserine lactone efflux protein